MFTSLAEEQKFELQSCQDNTGFVKGSELFKEREMRKNEL